MKLVRLPSHPNLSDEVINVSKVIYVSIVVHPTKGNKWVHIEFEPGSIVNVHFTEDVKLYHFHKRLLEAWSKSLDFVQGYSEMDRPGGVIDLAAELENLVQTPNG